MPCIGALTTFLFVLGSTARRVFYSIPLVDIVMEAKAYSTHYNNPNRSNRLFFCSLARGSVQPFDKVR